MPQWKAKAILTLSWQNMMENLHHVQFPSNCITNPYCKHLFFAPQCINITLLATAKVYLQAREKFLVKGVQMCRHQQRTIYNILIVDVTTSLIQSKLEPMRCETPNAVDTNLCFWYFMIFLNWGTSPPLQLQFLWYECLSGR